MSVLPTTRLRTSRLVVEPAASRHVHPMETGFPIAVAAAAAAAPGRVGGSAMPVAAAPGGELLRLGGGNGVVPSEPWAVAALSPGTCARVASLRYQLP